MGVINLEHLEPGMVLAADIKDRIGRVLLGAGHEITEKHIRIFKMWGISEADVKGVEQEEVVAKVTASIDPERLRQAEEHMKELFTHAGTESAFMKELQRLVTFRSARKPEEAHDNTL